MFGNRKRDKEILFLKADVDVLERTYRMLSDKYSELFGEFIALKVELHALKKQQEKFNQNNTI